MKIDLGKSVILQPAVTAVDVEVGDITLTAVQGPPVVTPEVLDPKDPRGNTVLVNAFSTPGAIAWVGKRTYGQGQSVEFPVNLADTLEMIVTASVAAIKAKLGA